MKVQALLKLAFLVACAFTAQGPATTSASAQSILEDWSTVTAPPLPVIQPVTLEAEHTALLILDMYARTCVAPERPRCVPTIPRVAQLLAQARAHGARVVFAGGPWTSDAPNTPVAALAPRADEHLVRGMADKFLDTELEQMLTASHIQNVIVVGASANSALLHTATGAAFRNFNVIVPVDGISARTAYEEQYALYHLKNASRSIADRVTLTTVAQITLH